VKHLNLSHFTIPFITYLYEHDGVHQDELAEKLQYDKSSAARAVSALVQQGYATKHIDETNKRRNIIEITAKGLSTKEELISILMETTDSLFNNFSSSEKNEYFELMNKIENNICSMLADKE